MLLAAVLLALHSFGEAFHYRAHLPSRQTSQVSARSRAVARAVSPANRIASRIDAAASVASSDDDCAFCALTATAARQSAPPAPALATPVALAAARSFVPTLTSVAPSCRPRAPGPPRAPPAFFA